MDTGEQNIFVLFSEPLIGGLLVLENWAGRIANVAVKAVIVLATGSFVIVNYANGEADEGPDEISYSAATPDVVGQVSALPAAAFASYPVT